MESINNQYVVEWSEKQGCFHINDLKGMIQSNYRAYLAARKMDYIPLFFTDTTEKAHSFVARMKKERARHND